MLSELDTAAAEAVIRAGTYPGFGDEAVALYGRMQTILPLSCEPIHFGERALDVGSKDGRHHSIIKALGSSGVTAIDPNAAGLARGVRNGVLAKDEAFEGSLQQWVEAGHKPIDAAFVLNMLPRLSGDFEFLRALSRAVTIGGLAVVSFMKPSEGGRFTDMVIASSLKLRPLIISIHDISLAPQAQRSGHISIWRKEG